MNHDKRILTVDDSPEVRILLGYILRRAGYRVSEAVNGEAGLQMIRNEHFDLVITDLRMPLMDGITLIRETRLLPDRQQLPIIVLTSETCGQLRRAGKSAGALEWLTKPLVPQQILQVVRMILVA